MESFKIKEEQVLDLTDDIDEGENNEIKREGIPLPFENLTIIPCTSDVPDDQKYTLQVYPFGNCCYCSFIFIYVYEFSVLGTYFYFQ